MLVEAHVREELAHAVVAEGGVGERVAGLRAGAALDVFGVDGHGARGDPGSPGDHPFPAILDRLDAAVGEAEVRLVVHAVQALHDGLLQLVDDLRALAGVGVDFVDPLVVDLDLQILRPAAVAAQPAARARLGHRALHELIVCIRLPAPRGSDIFSRRNADGAPRGRPVLTLALRPNDDPRSTSCPSCLCRAPCSSSSVAASMSSDLTPTSVPLSVLIVNLMVRCTPLRPTWLSARLPLDESLMISLPLPGALSLSLPVPSSTGLGLLLFLLLAVLGRGRGEHSRLDAERRDRCERGQVREGVEPARDFAREAARDRHRHGAVRIDRAGRGQRHVARSVRPPRRSGSGRCWAHAGCRPSMRP